MEHSCNVGSNLALSYGRVKFVSLRSCLGKGENKRIFQNLLQSMISMCYLIISMMMNLNLYQRSRSFIDHGLQLYFLVEDDRFKPYLYGLWEKFIEIFQVT